jgi:PAS domain S-box-containing protein
MPGNDRQPMAAVARVLVLEVSGIGVVTTIKGKCRECYACVRNCPVKAIKVENGQATVIEELCISCGYCVRVCAQHAKHIREDLVLVKNALATGKACALLAPAFAVEFNKELRPGQVVSALKQLGFVGVYEVAWGAERVTQEYIRIIEGDHEPGIISTPCPAIVNLVEGKYPHLVPRLVPVVSPMVAAGRMIKKELEGAYTVFIGPCVAKKSEMLDPSVADAIDAVLTFVELRELLRKLPIDLEGLPDTDFQREEAYLGRLYPVSGGLLRSAALSADMVDNEILVVEGKDNCIDFLEALSAKDDCPEFVDMLFCEGCINGPMMTTDLPSYARRVVAVDFAKQSQRKGSGISCVEPRFPEIQATRKFSPESIDMPIPTEEEIERILRELDKTEPEDELNCGACGYSTCREKAVAVFRGLAENKMCLPYLITQLELHNTELARLKAYHEDTIDSIIEGIVVVDPNMIITGLNKSADMYSTSQSIGRDVFTVFPDLDIPRCRQGFQRAISLGEPTDVGEMVFLLGNEKVTLHIKISPLKNKAGEVYGAVLLSQDTTEKRRLESQLIQSDRLAALGQLAAGVAHEINTPLTLVLGYADILRDAFSSDNLSESYLKTIVEESERISDIVRSLLNFARPTNMPSGRCKVNETCRRTLRIFGGQMAKKGIQVTLELDESQPEAAIDTGELQQVILNMLLNAMQAMPEGGRLVIQTRVSQDVVEITITDTGIGIAPENLRKVFNPFFTTKEVGKGTGLGLSVSFDIIEKHGGTVKVESQRGEGTAFTIVLPMNGAE